MYTVVLKKLKLLFVLEDTFIHLQQILIW